MCFAQHWKVLLRFPGQKTTHMSAVCNQTSIAVQQSNSRLAASPENSGKLLHCWIGSFTQDAKNRLKEPACVQNKDRKSTRGPVMENSLTGEHNKFSVRPHMYLSSFVWQYSSAWRLCPNRLPTLFCVRMSFLVRKQTFCWPKICCNLSAAANPYQIKNNYTLGCTVLSPHCNKAKPQPIISWQKEFQRTMFGKCKQCILYRAHTMVNTSSNLPWQASFRDTIGKYACCWRIKAD